MEDSFRVRVGKIFGSLSSTSSSSLSSLWSLTDDEVERKEWNRDTEIVEAPGSSFNYRCFQKHREASEKRSMDFRLELEKDLDDVDDDFVDESESRRAAAKPDDYNDEEWEIKSNIGLDCTLDYEEEEDAYDKVAVGREKDGDRLYMSNIKDYGIEMDSSNVLPNSFRDVVRDPRANHLAAKIRLKEDAEAAKKMDSLRVSENCEPAVSDNTQITTSETGPLKSILKRKDNQLDSNLQNNQQDSNLQNNQRDLKSQKRVRFDPECKNDSDEDSERTVDAQIENSSSEDARVSNEASLLPPNYPSGIPDYMRNPSKYTRYTLDSSDLDEDSNRQAFMDFLKLLRKSDAMESEIDNAAMDLPKSVTFIPKRKTGDATLAENCSKLNQDDDGKGTIRRRHLPIGMAAGGSEDTEVCAMDEDELEISAGRRGSSERSGRHYRSKARLELDELS